MNENRTAYRATLSVAILLGLGILVLVNYVGARRFRRFDWTRSGLYTLSEKSVKVLKDLKQPVAVTVFMTEGSPLFNETQELLKRYKATSPLVSVETLDPARNRARAEALLKEFGVSGASVVFKSGDKKKHVAEGVLADYDFSRTRMGGEPTVKAFKGEQEFTSAILQVTQSRMLKVLFTGGHGERAFQARARDSFFTLAESLRRDNCTVEEWQSLGAPDVPAATDLLVVAGPKAAFTEGEEAAIKRYLATGGRALFFLDAEFTPGDASSMANLGLKGLLSEYGVRLDDDVVLDPKNALPMMGPETVFARTFRPHAVTRILEGAAVVFPLTRSVSVEKPPAGVTASILVETSADGWGETNMKSLESGMEKDDKDVKAPVPLAVAVETGGAEKDKEKDKDPDKDKVKKARFVVFGDADFASDGFVGNAANLYLLTAAANWALERESLVAIPPKDAGLVAVTLSRQEIGRIAFFVMIILPIGAIALGLAIWMKRRS